jgi:hypothetical protein
VTTSSSASKAIPFPAWLGWTAIVAALVLALIAFTLRLGQNQLRSRVRLAEEEARLARAELQAVRNQLEAERILAAAQTRLHREIVPQPPSPAPAAP